MAFDLLISLLLVLLNGFFVAAEFAIVKVRASQIELLVRNGSFLATVAQGVIIHLNQYLSATQLGITLSSLALGWYGERIAHEFVAISVGLVGVTSQNVVYGLSYFLS